MSEFILTDVTDGIARITLNRPAAINALARGNARALFRPGTMVGWRRPDLGAGPIWAAAGSEVAARFHLDEVVFVPTGEPWQNWSL